MTVSGNHRGVDGKSGELFKQARRSGLWPEAEAVHRSAAVYVNDSETKDKRN